MVGDKSWLLSWMAGNSGSCDHEYVKESPSGSFAIHVTLTVAPSLTVWSDPTLTVGLMLSVVTSSMVRTIVSSSERVPSSTVRVRVIVVLAVTEDAVTVGVAELELSKDNLESCDHEYVRSLSLPSGSEPDPCNVMEPPSSTCLSLPASALGAWLTRGTSCMVRTIVSSSERVPSSTVRVRVIVVLAVTKDAVTVGVAELELSKDNLESCDHEYVRSLSLPSGSEPDPCNVMEPPSSTCLSLPASALGAWLTRGTSCMVRTIVSSSERVPSSTVRVRVIVVLAVTKDAVTVGVAELELSKDNLESCDHEYVRSLSLPSGSEPDPCNVMEPPSSTCLSLPASALGAWLTRGTSCMVRTIVSSSERVPSSTVRVRVIVVLAVTKDAVTVGVAELELSKDNLESCDHEYVRSLSLPSGSEPDPCNVMEPPSSTCLSLPASALGAWLTRGTSCMVRTIVSSSERVPSSTVRVRVIVVLAVTKDAVTVGVAELELSKDNLESATTSTSGHCRCRQDQSLTPAT